LFKNFIWLDQDLLVRGESWSVCIVSILSKVQHQETEQQQPGGWQPVCQHPLASRRVGTKFWRYFSIIIFIWKAAKWNNGYFYQQLRNIIAFHLLYVFLLIKITDIVIIRLIWALLVRPKVLHCIVFIKTV